MQNLDKKFARHPNIVSRKIADEVVLVPIRRQIGDVQSVFTLNEWGAFIWDSLDGAKTVGEIREKVMANFEVAPEEAEADLDQFFAQLQEAGAVTEK